MVIKKFYSTKAKAGWKFDQTKKKFWSYGFDIYLESDSRKRESGFGTKNLATSAAARISLGEFGTGGSDEVYMIRADGDSMEAEIRSGDWLIVNRHLQARNGDRIVASVGGSLTVKVFSSCVSGLHLVASNGKYAPRKMSAKDDFEIFGVVTHVLHPFKKN